MTAVTTMEVRVSNKISSKKIQSEGNFATLQGEMLKAVWLEALDAIHAHEAVCKYGRQYADLCRKCVKLNKAEVAAFAAHYFHETGESYNA